MEMANAEVGSEFQKSDPSTHAMEAGDAHVSPVWSWEAGSSSPTRPEPSGPCGGRGPLQEHLANFACSRFL